MANTDPLTGAYNRRYLNEFSNDYLKIVKREKNDFSLLVVDLDDFKKLMILMDMKVEMKF